MRRESLVTTGPWTTSTCLTRWWRTRGTWASTSTENMGSTSWCSSSLQTSGCWSVKLLSFQVSVKCFMNPSHIEIGSKGKFFWIKEIHPLTNPRSPILSVSNCAEATHFFAYACLRAENKCSSAGLVLTNSAIYNKSDHQILFRTSFPQRNIEFLRFTLLLYLADGKINQCKIFLSFLIICENLACNCRIFIYSCWMTLFLNTLDLFWFKAFVWKVS